MIALHARRFLIIAAALLALAWSSPVRAQDGHAPPADAASAHEPGHDDHADDHADHEVVEAIPSDKQGMVVGVANIVLFFVILVVMATTVWPKINSGLAQRESKILSEIEAAEAARKQAKDALEQYERSLAEARSEAQKMLESTKAQQQALAAELRAKADAELTAMKEKATRDIESAKRAALNEIYTESATLATAMAGKILKREVSAGDQRRLVEETLGELQGVKR